METTAKPKTKAKAAAAPPPEELILEAVAALKANPKKYRALRTAIAKAKTDEAKVKQLMKYATSDRQLAALIPARIGRGPVLMSAWTTVTVTTVFIPDSAY